MAMVEGNRFVFREIVVRDEIFLDMNFFLRDNAAKKKFMHKMELTLYGGILCLRTNF
jgi:hypothetical protein